ncbi:MFS transporter, partial [Methanoculleus sp.]
MVRRAPLYLGDCAGTHPGRPRLAQPAPDNGRHPDRLRRELLLCGGRRLAGDVPRGRDATVLRKIRGTADVSDELGEIERSVLTEGAGTLSDLVAPAVRLPLLLGVGLAILQQATGINTVIYYAPTIFQFAGLTEATASIAATVGIGVVNVLVTFIAIRLVDRAGRRPLLLWSLAGMGIAMLLLGVGFALENSGAG